MKQPKFERIVQSTTCPYCGVGCGVNATVEGQSVIAVSGDTKHPANFGKLCVKGSNLHKTVGPSGRLVTPIIHGQEKTYDEAVSFVANAFSDSIKKYGPDSVAMYVSGQILTEDYYIANKFMKGLIGTANIDTNSRLCMSSAVAAYKRAFGSDTVPCNYEDLELADVLILVGSNAAFTHPILYQRMQAAKKQRPELQIIVIDPRHSATVEGSDLHLPIYPGTDVALFNGLLNYMVEHSLCDDSFITNSVDGFAEAITPVSTWHIDAVAQYTGVQKEAIKVFYNAFTQHKKVVTFYSQGVNQSDQGVNKAHAIINCHLAQGKIGYPGAGPFSITGQPNAMGGREVGGLANMLAAHMDIDNPEHRAWVSDFWQSDCVPMHNGLKAVDLFAAVKTKKIKVLWIMATNPVVSLPNRNEIEAALSACDCVIVSDCFSKNDTLAYADVILPSSTWSEKDGMVTNSERRISRQRGLVPPPGEAKHDWQVIRDVAWKMGGKSTFNYTSPKDIFCEHAALSGVNNGINGHPKRDFDISLLSDISEAQYNQFKPTCWPITAENPNGTPRMFTDQQFFTPNQRAKMWPTESILPSETVDSEYPFVLTSGRYRDQWHTMTRTGRAAELALNQPEPYLHLHPTSADSFGLPEHGFVRITSRYGSVVLPVLHDKGIRPNTCFAPIHWTQNTSHGASISRCFSSRTDPISGQPDSKFVAVKLAAEPIVQFSQIWSRTPLVLPCEYWTLIQQSSGFGYLTGTITSSSITEWQSHFAAEQWDWQFLVNPSTHRTNAIAFKDNKVAMILILEAKKVSLPWTWLEEIAECDISDEMALAQFLQQDIKVKHTQGKLICSCFKVGENTINAAIEQGIKTVDELGKALQCGTNCGSCKSELQQLLNVTKQQPLIHLQPV